MSKPTANSEEAETAEAGSSVPSTKASQRDFKMIFMNSSFSINQDVSHATGTIADETSSVQRLSMRTLRSAKYTASLRKAVSSMKIHSWKTDSLMKNMSSCENIETCNNLYERLAPKQVEWIQEFSNTGPVVNIKDPFMYNKLFARIRSNDEMNEILCLMHRGVSLFCYNLQYGTIDDHLAVWNRVAQARKFVSYLRDIPFIFSIIPELSYRKPLTGKLKPGLESIALKPGNRIIVTADRSYARRGSRKVIYVNCRHYVQQLRPIDYIRIGDVNLRVMKAANISVQCEIVTGGKVKSKMQVHLPPHLRPDPAYVSFEELEDMTFLIANEINCLVLPDSGTAEYLQSIREALRHLNFEQMRILSRVREQSVAESENASWIAHSYNGVILMCETCPCTERTLPDSTKAFMRLCYDLKKPLVLQCLHRKSCLRGVASRCSTDNFEYFFYYPDGYFLNECDAAVNFQLIHRTVQTENVQEMERLSYKKLLEPFVDKSTTGSDTMARVIAKMTYDFNAKAIIICSTSGRMPMKISHFRPKCPIVVLTKYQRATRFLKIFYNIRIAFYKEMPGAEKIPRFDLLLARLLHGLIHGLTLQIIGNDDVVIFCYKSPADNAYANVAIPFKMDSNTVKRHFDMINIKN